MVNQVKLFIQSLKKEWKMITWLSKKELRNLFKVVVIGILIILGIIVLGDLMGNLGIDEILKIRKGR